MKDKLAKLWTPVNFDGLFAIDLALKFFLLDLLFRPIGTWQIRPIIMAVAGLGLLSSKARHAPIVYFIIAVLAAYRVYILVYFPIAVLLAMMTPNPSDVLMRQCRLLIAAVFGFAVLWKTALTPEFLDGTFFRVTFQTDTRFEGFMLGVARITPEQLQLNRDFLMNPLPRGAVPYGESVYAEPERFSLLVGLFVWATLVLEGLIFIAFAYPLKSAFENVRHALLLLFCVGTYAIAPVPGFGWILLSMGVTLVHEESRIKIAYISCFVLLLFYRENAWRDFLWSALQPHSPI